jgi:hypothetical protein
LLRCVRFKSHPDIVMTGVPQEVVLSLLFHGNMAKGFKLFQTFVYM